MIQYETYIHDIPQEVLQEMLHLESLCFLNHDSARFLYEYEGKRGLVAVLAQSQGKYIGFKLGYERRQHQFYSWMGGVDPKFRRHGIARELMTRQHQTIKELGYRTVRTITSNQFKPMLILNLQSGFNIIGTQVSQRHNDIRLVLEKNL